MKNSIRFRLTFAFVSLAIFPLLIAGVFLSWQSYNNQRSQAVQIQREIGQRIAEQTSSLMGNAEAQLRVIGNEPGVFESEGAQGHTGHYATVLSSSKFFDDLILADSSGVIVSHIGRVAHSESVIQALDNRLHEDGSLESDGTSTALFGPVHFSANGNPTMSVSVPIINKRSGSTSGFAIGIVRLGVIWELIGNIRVGESGSAYIIDDQKRVIAHRNPSIILKQTLFEPVVSNGIGTGLNGDKSIITSQVIPIGTQRFSVITEKPFTEAMALTIRSLVTIGIILLVAMVAAGVTARFLGRIIVRPIEHLVTVAKSLESGELHNRATINSNDEFATLGSAFNALAERNLNTIDDLAFQNSALQNEVASRQFAEQSLEDQSRELAQSNRALESNHMISEIFNEPGDFGQKSTAALDALIILSGADWATFRLSKIDQPGLHLVAAAGPAVHEYPPIPVITPAHTLITAAFNANKITVNNDYRSWPNASPVLVEMGMQSMVILPVRVGEQTLGIVTLISRERGYFGSESVGLLTFVVERLGVVVNNSMLHDATEKSRQELQVLADALSRSNQELEQFANIASHDLQEPLRMVSSFTQLLESRYKDQLDSDAQEFIGYAVDGAKRMQTQIKDLLSYSRVTTQGQPLRATDCGEVLNQAVSNLSVSIWESNAVITNDNLPVVTGDTSQLVSVFQNLIGNAIKYMGDREPRIHVSAGVSGNDWLFSFNDNGIGIKQEYVDRIFLIFQRLHGKAEYSGTGIGLAICKKVIERHKGRIWVESEPEKGSTFYFTLPRTEDLPNIPNEVEQNGVEELEFQTD